MLRSLIMALAVFFACSLLSALVGWMMQPRRKPLDVFAEPFGDVPPVQSRAGAEFFARCSAREAPATADRTVAGAAAPRFFVLDGRRVRRR
jgi:hypothetical protein